MGKNSQQSSHFLFFSPKDKTLSRNAMTLTSSNSINTKRTFSSNNSSHRTRSASENNPLSVMDVLGQTYLPSLINGQSPTSHGIPLPTKISGNRLVQHAWDNVLPAHNQSSQREFLRATLRTALEILNDDPDFPDEAQD